MSKPATIMGKVVGEFYQEVDGMYKFEPSRDIGPGYWDEYMLMTILCKLRKLNIEWDYFCWTDPQISNMWEDEK
jgi:hypothetical protein